MSDADLMAERIAAYIDENEAKDVREKIDGAHIRAVFVKAAPFAENAMLRERASVLEADVEKWRTKAWDAERRESDRIAVAATVERTRIVALLREEADGTGSESAQFALRSVADAIEREVTTRQSDLVVALAKVLHFVNKKSGKNLPVSDYARILSLDQDLFKRAADAVFVALQRLEKAPRE